MGRTILCQHCNSTLNEDILKQRNSENVCLICGKPLDYKIESKKTSYYYKEGGGMLDDTLSSKFTPSYTFEAVDLDVAKRQLKDVLPNSPLFKSVTKVQCPYYFSTEEQMVPKKFSLLTGFTTNGYNRVCVRCRRKF